MIRLHAPLTLAIALVWPLAVAAQEVPASEPVNADDGLDVSGADFGDDDEAPPEAAGPAASTAPVRTTTWKNESG